MLLTPDMRDERLFFLDIASPQTRANLERSPWLELNVVDQLSRRGYRFAGAAMLHHPGSTVYDEGVRRVYGDATPSSRPSAVVLLTVERAAPVLSPAYWRGLHEHDIPAQWRGGRPAADRGVLGVLSGGGPGTVSGT